MAASTPPTGTVTFLFTDIEGSTRLWEADHEAMAVALADHDRILRSAVEGQDGYVFATGGDGMAVAFQRAGDAMAAAKEAARILADHPWPEGVHLKVRMALHTGEVIERDGDYFGPALNRAARLMATAHGGQIVCSQATAGLLASEPALKALGTHRLRDLGSPETVFQVGEYAFPPLRSLEAHPTNLPVQLTSFVGRDRELADLAKAMEASRLVTLTGVGGVGKTRLAMQAAADALGQLPDGAWLVELGALADAGAVGEVFCSAVGVTPSGTQSHTDAFVTAIKDREALLVVDNCEHLLAAAAELVERVLKESPQLRVLATSREALGVPGEQVFPVPALGMDGEDSSATGAEAVRLMVERALAVRPDFALTESSGLALREIARRLDGIPLAIELAAARLRSMTPEDLAGRLDQTFRLLTGGSRLAVSRHQTLRATVDWSYDLLDADERAVFQVVSIFAGGFGLGAAEAVCDLQEGADVFDVLTRLVDKSLVLADYAGGTTRYRMLNTIRDYALDRLRAERDVDEVRRRHALWYAAFSEGAGEGLCGPDDRTWLDRVEAELENLRSAVVWAVEAKEPSLVARLVAPLTLEVLSTERAVGSWAELALGVEGIEAQPVYPRLAAFVAYLRTVFGRPGEGQDLLRRAWESIGPPTAENAYLRARVLSSENILASSIGGMEKWARLADERLAAAREAGSDYEICRALSMVAVIAGYRGEDHRETAAEAAEIARRSGNTFLMAAAFAALSQATAPFDTARALTLLDEAERHAVACRSSFFLATINNSRARLFFADGDHSTAFEAAADVIVSDWEYDGNLSRAAAHLHLMAVCLSSVGGLDELAAVAEGVWSATRDRTHQDRWIMLSGGREGDLAPLAERLGLERYEALMEEGARLTDLEVIDLVRRAVREFRGLAKR